MALEFYFLIRLSDNLRIQHFWKLEVLPPFPESNSVKVLPVVDFDCLASASPEFSPPFVQLSPSFSLAGNVFPLGAATHGWRRHSAQ